MIKKIFLLICISFSFTIFAENKIIGISGEIIISPLSKINSDSEQVLYAEYDGIMYAIIGMPYSHKEKIISIGNSKITILPKDYGESRINITDSSKVVLNKENAARATKEALLIKKNIALYSHKSLSDLDFNLPVDGIISSRFGKKRYINDIPRSPHMALDIAAPKGTSIFSPSDGKVVLVGDFFYGGKYVLLDHGMGLLTSYSHMSEILVEEGMIIIKGQEIGLVGSTGRVTGPHLHWTVYLNKERVNPELFLNKNIITTISDL